MGVGRGPQAAPLTAANVVAVFAIFTTGALVAVAGSQLRKLAEQQRDPKRVSNDEVGA